MLYVKTNNRYRAATKMEVLEAAAPYKIETLYGVNCGSPTAAAEAVRDALAGFDYEVFGALFLSTRHSLISGDILFRGTVDGASVHPRQVVKRALDLNAAAVVLFHNHPSGNSEPSTADEMITSRLKEALALVDIRVLDHFIVAG